MCSIFFSFFLLVERKIKVIVIDKTTNIYPFLDYFNQMAVRNTSKDAKRISHDCLSSSALEVVLDDQSLSDSADEFSDDQPR